MKRFYFPSGPILLRQNATGPGSRRLWCKKWAQKDVRGQREVPGDMGDAVEACEMVS